MKTDALTILETAIDAIDNRAAERDVKAERSMKRTVDIYNAWSGAGMTEYQGWMFMVCLKMARARAGEHRMDDYVDLAGYASLAAESIDFKHIALELDDFDEEDTDNPEITIEPPCDVESPNNPLASLPTKDKGPERKWDTQKYLASKTSSNSSNAAGSSSQPTAAKSTPASNGDTSSINAQAVKNSYSSARSSTPAAGASSPASSAGSRSSTSTSPSTVTGSPKTQPTTSKPRAAAGTTLSGGKRATKGA